MLFIYLTFLLYGYFAQIRLLFCAIARAKGLQTARRFY